MVTFFNCYLFQINDIMTIVASAFKVDIFITHFHTKKDASFVHVLSEISHGNFVTGLGI